ncbi:methyltransferase domain-containing protein [Lentzea tibetensis]
MLEALQVAEGQTVLEIGTGTGWNAALLAKRLRSDAITSVDINPTHVAQARERLTLLGLTPTLAVADGYLCYEQRAPYDRLIATASAREIPPAWLGQLRPGGVILIDIRGSFAGNLARLTVTADQSAHGRFLPESVSFMPLRSPEQPCRSFSELGGLTGRVAGARGESRTTNLDPGIFRQPAFAFFAQLTLSGALNAPVAFEDGPSFFCVIHPDSQAWARVELGTGTDYPVTQGGERRLWDELEAAHALWQRLDQPSPEDFTITIGINGQQVVSLAQADRTWHLPL